MINDYNGDYKVTDIEFKLSTVGSRLASIERSCWWQLPSHREIIMDATQTELLEQAKTMP